MSTSFRTGGALRNIAVADTSISTISTTAWSATLVSMLRADGAPDALNMLLPLSILVTTAATSIGLDELDL
jgi:hypothetical protein